MKFKNADELVEHIKNELKYLETYENSIIYKDNSYNSTIREQMRSILDIILSLQHENNNLRKKVKPESPSSPTNLKMDLRDI